MRKEPILELFHKIKPKRLLECGTWLGEGSTRIILDSLKECGVPKWEFYTIESNKTHYDIAVKNLENDNVNVIHGTSIPKSLLPDREYITNLINQMPSHVFIDHNPASRVDDYYNSANSELDVKDDIIGELMSSNNNFDVILLDSSGHIGEIEFEYLLGKLTSSCYFILDDVDHIKHYRNFEKIKIDERFEVIQKFDERFGWVIIKYNHPVSEVIESVEVVEEKKSPKKVAKKASEESKVLAVKSKEAISKALKSDKTKSKKGDK